AFWGFLTGSGGGSAELNLVGSGSSLTGSRGGFTELNLVGFGRSLTGGIRDWRSCLLVGSGYVSTALAFIGCRSADGGGSTYAPWLWWEQPPSVRDTAKTPSATTTHIFKLYRRAPLVAAPHR